MAYDSFLLVLTLIALGKLLARTHAMPDNSAETLNRFALMVCLPAAVLRFGPRLEFSAELLGLVAIPFVLLLVTIALVELLVRWLRLDAGERAVLLLCVPLGNTSFLGYPLIEAFLGTDALPYAVAYDQLGSFVILCTWGLWVLARYGGDKSPTVGSTVKRMLGFPAFPAMIIALTVMPAEPPGPIAAVLERLADALLPVVALAIGFQLRFRIPANERAPLAAGLAAKLLLLPALAWALAIAFDLPPLMAQTTVLESAMAPMISAGALAVSHRLAPTLAAALVGFGTPLSLLTLPLWRWLVA